MPAKWLIVVIFILIAFLGSKAQQLPQISQYSFNNYVINPATAGVEDYFEVKSMNRYQWTGLTDAPRTFTIALTAPFKNPRVAMGGYLFVDNVGPTRRTGIQASYAYHLPLNENLKLSFSASMGVMQFAIDGSRITLATDGDPALFNTLNSKILFDAKFGAYLYSESFYLGFTLPQLLQNKVDLFNTTDPSLSRLEDHYLINAGYKWQLNEDFMLEPSALIKYVDPAPIKIDATLRVFYKTMVWAGGSWRNNDAWVAMAGYEWNEQVSLGYAFDFTTSNLKNYSDGTHEIVLGLKFK
jgi:type IX secretion system PorP/SprF family membrane protein